MPMLYVMVLAGGVIAVALFTAVSRLREQGGTFEHMSRELLTRLQKVEERMEQTERTMQQHLGQMRLEQREDARSGREEQTKALTTLGDSQVNRIKEIGELQRQSLESFSQQLTNVSRAGEEKLETMRGTIEAKLMELQKGNEEKLEKMRATVDEKLHTTLEKRLGEAFASVSDRLEQVHQGLGEMKALSSDVGDLKKVLSNVKVRGTWGEMQLAALLEQILTPAQYLTNTCIKPNGKERVEFAIILPGAREDNEPVLLPIDSKFPMEDYQRLIAASESADTVAVADAREALKNRVISEAKMIKEKYVEPPYTTDFGILYLPVEGLYAEVLRINGLCESLSQNFRVVPAGPTTIAALLNSLQMGFRTLAIEKRSSEVWALLGVVKTEFGKFGGILEKTRQRIDQAGKELENAQRKTKTISSKLKKVQQLPSGEDNMSALNASSGDNGEIEEAEAEID